ncbi:hypothetical protein D9M71_173280 [compost metagenome]
MAGRHAQQCGACEHRQRNLDSDHPQDSQHQAAGDVAVPRQIGGDQRELVLSQLGGAGERIEVKAWRQLQLLQKNRLDVQAEGPGGMVRWRGVQLLVEADRDDPQADHGGVETVATKASAAVLAQCESGETGQGDHPQRHQQRQCPGQDQAQHQPAQVAQALADIPSAQAQQAGFEAQGEQHAPEGLQPDHGAELPGVQGGSRHETQADQQHHRGKSVRDGTAYEAHARSSVLLWRKRSRSGILLGQVLLQLPHSIQASSRSFCRLALSWRSAAA